MITNNSTLNVSEYYRIRDSDQVEDLKKLYLNGSGWSKYLSIEGSTAHFRHYVGTVQTKNFRFSILPKIWTGDEAEANKNLMRLLLYTYKTPSLFEPEVSISPKYENNDLFELLILFYSMTLEKQLNQGMYRRYVKRDEESRYLRGKLNLQRQLNRYDRSLFDITDFRFSADNEMNRHFAHATSIFSTYTRDIRSLDLLSSIETLFKSEGVQGQMLSSPLSFNRLNDRFQIPYNYADLILKHLNPEPGNEKQSMMMLFDMNIVFQEFFVRFIKRNKSTIFPGKFVKISPQYKRKNFIFNESGALRFTIPDLKIECRSGDVTKTFILDLKYKLMNSVKIENSPESSEDDIYGISSSDLYQMFTYSDLYDSDDTILIFPGSKNDISDPYKFKETGHKLWICMLHLDFNNDGWEKTLAVKFQTFFNRIGPS